MKENNERRPRYEFAELHKSIEDLADLARVRGVDFTIEDMPEAGVRQLWFDQAEVAEISQLNAAICAFRQPDGSERVRTLSGFIPILSRLLGHKAVL